VFSCYFVSRGLSAQDAMAKVHEMGRTAYETKPQCQVIKDYERSRGSRTLGRSG
jgi:hypothetical protein